MWEQCLQHWVCVLRSPHTYTSILLPRDPSQGFTAWLQRALPPPPHLQPFPEGRAGGSGGCSPREALSPTALGLSLRGRGGGRDARAPPQMSPYSVSPRKADMVVVDLLLLTMRLPPGTCRRLREPPMMNVSASTNRGRARSPAQAPPAWLSPTGVLPLAPHAMPPPAWGVWAGARARPASNPNPWRMIPGTGTANPIAAGHVWELSGLPWCWQSCGMRDWGVRG